MTLYRNRYFLLGVLLILLGIQFRMVHSFVLNERATRVMARFSKRGPIADNAMVALVYPNQTMRVEPPRWLGLAMITVGSIISLHALSIPKHGG